MQQAISKIQIESFLVGLGVGIVGSYVVYKTLTPKRFKWESVWSMKLWKKTDLSEKEIDRMIEFFFAEPGVYLPYPEGPIGSLEFAARCALLCEKNTEALQDFTGEVDESTCLDIGCSVGATTFELSKCFVHVLGIDPSKELISVAEQMKEKRTVEYSTLVGRFKERRSVRMDPNLELDGVRFMVADPCNLPTYLTPVDCILAALLLSRLQHPKRFLEAMPRLIKKGGTLVLVSSYDSDHVGTFRKPQSVEHDIKDAKARLPPDWLKDILTNLGFDLVCEDNLSYLKRDNATSYRWQVARATVWKHRTQQEAPSKT